jgi:hypothetical protein
MAAEEGGAPARQFSPVGPGPLGRGPWAWRVGGVEAVGAGGCRSDRRGRRRIDDEHGSLADVIKEWEMSETEGLAVLALSPSRSYQRPRCDLSHACTRFY